VGGEPNVVGGGHHHVGDHAGLQAAHPVGQHHLRHSAEGFETFGQQRQRGRRFLVGGEADEPPP
jgi:hypothetical protein